MNDTSRPALRRRALPIIAGIVVLAAATVGIGYAVFSPKPAADVPEPQLRPEPPEATSEQVHQICAACHAYPPPETFPRSAWKKEVQQGYDFFHKDLTYRFEYPAMESVLRYYERRAPETLAPAERPPEGATGPPPFERRGYRPPAANSPPGVAHVNLVHLRSKDKLDVLVCDALSKEVLIFSPYESPPSWKVIARGLSCAHAEVVDLDGDGNLDVILACLGNFYATDDRVGSVVWLKGAADGTFTPITLLDGIGRVADVRAADFRGSGKLDLVVAEFGWHEAGSILLLENQTTDSAKPQFIPRILDKRHGATHVPVADLNGDGKPDFVAAISQEFESVVAFVNQGGGQFAKETIFTGSHPTLGTNGIQLVDLNGDGKLDVLLSNGDSLDPPYLLRPDHGVTWLENRGAYPFAAHRLANSYGAGSPVAADFRGSGRLDVAYVNFLPVEFFPQRAPPNHVDAVGLLTQIEPGKFVHRAIEEANCDHLTCAAGDLDGDGLPDLVVGNYVRGGGPGDSITIWWNKSGKPAPK